MFARPSEAAATHAAPLLLAQGRQRPAAPSCDAGGVAKGTLRVVRNAELPVPLAAAAATHPAPQLALHATLLQARSLCPQRLRRRAKTPTVRAAPRFRRAACSLAVGVRTPTSATRCFASRACCAMARSSSTVAHGTMSMAGGALRAAAHWAAPAPAAVSCVPSLDAQVPSWFLTFQCSQ